MHDQVVERIGAKVEILSPGPVGRRMMQGWIEGRVDVAAHATGPEFTYFAEAIGTLASKRHGIQGVHRPYRQGRKYNQVQHLQVPVVFEPGESDFFDEILDLTTAAPFLSSGNTYLFLGNGSGSWMRFSW
jgi:hypothetical protein